ncbi:hypothetical protein CG432_16200 [Pantoea ananatis]|nr:hypothetical protein CG432_16200 [Pantoea ananatis]
MREARQVRGKRVLRRITVQLPDDAFTRHQSSDKKRPVSMNATGQHGGDENISDNRHITTE